MKHSVSKALRVTLLSALILCFFCASALADAAIVAETARAYAQPSTAAKSVKLSAGTQVEILAEKSGWAQVSLNGQTGYMKAAALAKVTTYSDQTVYAKAKITVYKSLGSSKKLGTVAAGTALQLEATAGSWACVSLNGKKGYVKKNQLTTEAPAAPAAPAPEATPAPAEKATRITAYVAHDGAKVYKSYSSGAKVLTTLPLNTVLTVTAAKDGWCRVEKDGVTAYMHQADLSTSKQAEPEPAATPEPAAAELKYGDKGEAVKALQRRLKELGYFSGEIGGNYLELTQSAVRAFQSEAKLTADGVAGASTLKALAADDAPKAPATQAPSGSSGQSTVTPATGTAKEMDWWTSGIQNIFARGTVAQVTDIATGISWREVRKGGSNHADCQPLTAADTAAMKKACGSWSWNRRAIWVTINGVNYAASMNCMPHGSNSIPDNDFPGHHCIHFTNSRTHGGNKVCPQHQAAIKKAAAASR